tara:strand:+ start:160 stop:432 length:273 start_codon:yes stop_codon:yes gene_type:complete
MTEQRKKYLDENCHISLYEQEVNHIGWFKEFYSVTTKSSEFLGTIEVDEPDREHVGYEGRKQDVADSRLKKYKKLRGDEKIISILYPLQG